MVVAWPRVGFPGPPCLHTARGRPGYGPGLNDVLDGPRQMGQQARPASEPQATAVAQTHVSARVDDRVHLAGRSTRCTRCSCRPAPSGRTWATPVGLGKGAGRRHCREENRQTSTSLFPGGLCWATHEGRASVPEPKGDNSGRHRVQFFSSYAPLPVASTVITLGTPHPDVSPPRRMRGWGQGPEGLAQPPVQPISLHSPEGPHVLTQG